MNTQIWSRSMRAAATAGALALALAGSSLAADFTADVVTKMGKMTMPGKLYVQGKKVRQETKAMGGQQVSIMRPDKKVAWVLFPDKKQYMEKATAGTSANSEFDGQMLKMAVKKNLGKATVNGMVCDKTQYTFKDKSMGTCTQWVSKELAWPVKTEMKNSHGTMVTECRNIKKGKPASKLFEIPKGYKKAPMPKMMPGKRPPMGGKSK